MGKRRTLAEELAELATTAPATNVDAEIDDLGDEAKLISSGEEPEERTSRKRQRRAPEKGLRIRADIQLDDETYGGQKRAASAEDSENSDPESSSEEAAGTLEDSGSSELHNEDFSKAVSCLQNAEESAEGLPGPLGKGPTAGVDHTSSELDMPEAQGAGIVLMHQAKPSLDQSKADAVRSQKAVWERLLEARILLQQMIATSHRLPPHNVWLSAIDASKGLAEHSQTASKECISTIEVLLDLNKAMLDRNPEIRQAQRDLGVAVPALDEAPLSGRIWDQVDASYVTIKEFRDSSLDRWHRKALLGSGQTNLKGTLQRLDQTVSGQVASLMRDQHRLMKKMQLPLLDAPQPLCTEAIDDNGKKQGKDTNLPTRDPERFDDSEFYQLLLKEFLEVKGAGAATQSVQPSLKTKKIRKMCDRRASKGRRLRYAVQEKLVNFMVPKTYEELPMASQLLRNLFGQGAN